MSENISLIAKIEAKNNAFDILVDGANVAADTTNFDNNLSVADNTVQKALDTIDELALGSNYTKTITISPAGGDYTKIQSALDVNAAGGELFLVYPGTYTDDTINLTANNQCVKGMGCSPKSVLVTNTAQICNYGATTGGVLENIKMVMTPVINTIDITITGTGSCNFKFCHAEAVITGANNEASGSSCYAGSGTNKIVEGSIVYTNTSTRGGRGKKAVNVEAGSSWLIDDVTFTVTGSSTSSTISAIRDVSSGEVIVDKCDISVEDNESDATYAISVVNGSGDAELKYNDVHVINNTNIAAGGYFDSDDSSLSIRSSFNHIHAESSAGTANFVILNDASVTFTSQFDDVIAEDGVKSDNGAKYNYVNSLEDGDLFANGTISTGDIEIKEHAYFDAEYDNGNSGAADTIDWGNGNKQMSTLSNACSYTFTAPDGVGNFLLRLVQDTTGGHAVTWPVNVLWPDSTEPTITATANAVSIVSLYYDSSDYYGVSSLNFG